MSSSGNQTGQEVQPEHKAPANELQKFWQQYDSPYQGLDAEALADRIDGTKNWTSRELLSTTHPCDRDWFDKVSRRGDSLPAWADLDRVLASCVANVGTLHDDGSDVVREQASVPVTPQPWHGDLDTPALIILGLNPGQQPPEELAHLLPGSDDRPEALTSWRQDQ